MLHSNKVIESVIRSLKIANIKNIVLDPVMVAKGGAKLIDDNAIKMLKDRLIKRVMLARETSVLERMEKLLVQAEMEIRTEESLKAIEKGEVISIDDFRKENKAWAKKKNSK